MDYKVKTGVGYTLVFNELWSLYELSNNAKLLYIVGVSFRGYDRITQEILIARLNVSKPTFYKAQVELAKAGLIEIEHSFKKGCIKVNAYTFIENPNEWRIIKEKNQKLIEEHEELMNILNHLKAKWTK